MFKCVVLSSTNISYVERFQKIFVLTLLASLVCSEVTNLEGGSDSQGKDSQWDCELLDACSDLLGFEAIRLLHYQLDDDANGDVDVIETDEFLRDELNYENGYERQKGFHRNDKHITVDELWMTWKSSEVHNWTVEETITWLTSNVELPQYAEAFQEHQVNGTTLPRMAINSSHFLSSVLGIKDPIHKHKISLKAMDIVLFGPSKSHNYVKDVILVFSIIIATAGCWFAHVQHKHSQTQMRKMTKDMESLQHAEESLLELQKELDRAKVEQEIVVSEKKQLEERLQNEISAVKQQQLKSDPPTTLDEQSKVHQLEEELKVVLQKMHVAEQALQTKSWVPPSMLQHWLQMTHELELRHYNAKKKAAEQQLGAAKEGYEKLRKKKTNFMGAFRVAHGSSIDDVDNRILAAKAALSEVTKDLQERLHRWKQIEVLCGFPIVHNPGLHRLQSLVGNAMNKGILSSHTTVKSRISRSGSVSTLTDDDASFSSGVSARSLANISVGCSPHMGIHLDALEHSMRNAVSPDLKTCASSNAILQCSDSVNHEQLEVSHPLGKPHKSFQDASSIDDSSLCYSPAASEKGRPVFTVGSNKDIITRSPVKKSSPKGYSYDESHGGKENSSPALSYKETCLDFIDQKEKFTFIAESAQSRKMSSLGSSVSIESKEGRSSGSNTAGDERNRKGSTVANSSLPRDKIL